MQLVRLVLVFLLAGLGSAGAQPFSPATPISISGTITAGGTAQLLVAAGGGPNRRVFIQNLSTDPLCISKFTVTPVCGTNGTYTLSAGTSSIPGGTYSTTNGINDSLAFYIIGATTGDKFTAEYSE